MEGSVRQRPGRAGRQDLLQQAICAHTGRRHRAVTWCPTRASSGRARKLAYPSLTTSNANAPVASGGARPSAWRKSIQPEDPAHRSGFAFCFHYCSSMPWPSEIKSRLLHVPRPSPCSNHLGFRSRWTAEEEMRKKRALYTTETSVECPNLAGLQHDSHARASSMCGCGSDKIAREIRDTHMPAVACCTYSS